MTLYSGKIGVGIATWFSTDGVIFKGSVAGNTGYFGWFEPSSDEVPEPPVQIQYELNRHEVNWVWGSGKVDTVLASTYDTTVTIPDKLTKIGHIDTVWYYSKGGPFDWSYLAVVLLYFKNDDIILSKVTGANTVYVGTGWQEWKCNIDIYVSPNNLTEVPSIKIIPVVSSELKKSIESDNMLLINKLAEKEYVKEEIIPECGVEYPLYIYNTTKTVTPAVRAYDKDRNYYDVSTEKNKVVITFPEKRKIPDVVYLEITDANNI